MVIVFSLISVLILPLLNADYKNSVIWILDQYRVRLHIEL